MISETALRLYAAKREGVLKTNAQFWREFSHVEAVNALPVDPEKYERELQDADLQLTCAFDADFPPLPPHPGFPSLPLPQQSFPRPLYPRIRSPPAPMPPDKPQS